MQKKQRTKSRHLIEVQKVVLYYYEQFVFTRVFFCNHIWLYCWYRLSARTRQNTHRIMTLQYQEKMSQFPDVTRSNTLVLWTLL